MGDEDGARGGGVPGRRARRAAGLERTGSERRRVYVPLKRRAARFLAVLAECGNATLAREAAGLGKDRLYTHRKENAEFARDWAAALAAFEARAEAEDERAMDSELEGDGLVLRRGRGGRVQVVKRRAGQWTSAKEEAALAALAETGTASAAAAAAGMSANSLFERRRASPAFAARMDAVREAATEGLEWLLLKEGTNLLARAAGDGAKPDPQLAMWILKRRDQAQAGTLKHGAAAAQLPPAEEVRERILRKVAAIRAHTERGRIAAGWTRDEEGRMIPPGWVRSDGPVEPSQASSIDPSEG
jgi:hypothetical protein